MTVTEATAKLEAKLRGGTAWHYTVPRGEFWRIVSGARDELATDPATDTGAWEWLRLLNQAGYYGSLDNEQIPAKRDGSEWHIEIGPVCLGTDDPLEAVAAAVEALAESEAAARTS